MASTLEQAVTAAREAERRLWQHYGLTVAERVVHIETPPLDVRTLEFGSSSAEPLVFVQGGLGDAFGWGALMARLTDFRCISLDRPGGGFSDGVDFRTVDLRQLAADVLQAVLDAAGVNQATFLGNSMGGWWTFQLAMRAPARVSRMVMLGCPAVIHGTSAPLPLRLISVPVLGDALVRSMTPASPAKAREIPIALGHPAQVGERWSPAEAEAHYRFGNLPNFRRSWLTLLRRFQRLRGPNAEMMISEDELRRVAQPTLFIWGTDDPFGSPGAGQAAAALMPNAQFRIVGRGHLPWWDEPDECARLVREFLRSAR